MVEAYMLNVLKSFWFYRSVKIRCWFLNVILNISNMEATLQPFVLFVFQFTVGIGNAAGLSQESVTG
jgi:hypothetical protein